MYEAITAGDKDFSALITKMKEAGVELIYYGGYHTEAGLIVRQAHEQGLTRPLMSGDALVDQQFWAITGATGEGTLMTFAPDPRKLPTAAAVVEEFEADGYDPEGYTLYTYAAIQAFAEAAAKAGSTELEAVAKALHANTFDTVLGHDRLRREGRRQGPEVRDVQVARRQVRRDQRLRTPLLVNGSGTGPSGPVFLSHTTVLKRGAGGARERVAVGVGGSWRYH